MRRHNLTFLVLAMVAALIIIAAGCNNTGGNGTNGTESASADNGKVPITTSSDEAKKEYLQGRDLAENLSLQDSLEHFDKAISLDPSFAMAELARANASPTAKEFFEHLKKAVALADKASDGEKLVIQAAEAGSNGDAAKQKETLDKLVAAFPNDERAHFALGGYYFGQQDFTKAIDEYKKATEINDKFAPVYNILGYAYRQNGDFTNAEVAFKKYIELIPKDPNPYDSYGELLLKMGKFDDSIAQYRKALEIDKNFVASHSGIAAALMYQGKYDEARAELQKISESARSDGDRQTALFGAVVADVDSGAMDKALANVDKLYELAEKRNDSSAMSGNMGTKGTLLVAMGKYDEAKAAFEKSLKMIEDSDLSQEIKDNAKWFNHYNMATIAIGKNDMEAAKKESEEFSKGAEASKNPAQVRQAHELAGMIALAGKDYDKAIAELEQSSLQNPRNLYRLAEAFQGKGDAAKAGEFGKKAAEFNSLPQINYALIRTKAAKMAGAAKSE
jgi:tetratricopeptide (TPR) repeat protein